MSGCAGSAICQSDYREEQGMKKSTLHDRVRLRALKIAPPALAVLLALFSTTLMSCDKASQEAADPGGAVPASTPAPTVTDLPEGSTDIQDNVGDRMGLEMCGGAPCPQVGAQDAPVTVIELSDYRCSHCSELVLDVLPTIVAEYVDAGSVRLVSHVVAWEADARPAAGAALCAANMGMYFEFQRAAFENSLGFAGPEPDAQILDAARSAGIESDTFQACVEDRSHDAEVQASTVEAMIADIQYTPAMLINGLLIEGGQPIDLYRKKIDEALAEVAAGP